MKLQGKWYNFDCYAGFMTELDGLGMGLLGHHGFFQLFDYITLDSKNKVVTLSTTVS